MKSMRQSSFRRGPSKKKLSLTATPPDSERDSPQTVLPPKAKKVAATIVASPSSKRMRAPPSVFSRVVLIGVVLFFIVQCFVSPTMRPSLRGPPHEPTPTRREFGLKSPKARRLAVVAAAAVLRFSPLWALSVAKPVPAPFYAPVVKSAAAAARAARGLAGLA